MKRLKRIAPIRESGSIIVELRDIFHTRQADWLSLTTLVADLKCQNPRRYKRATFWERDLMLRLGEYGVQFTRRGPRTGIAWVDLERYVRKFAPGKPRLVVVNLSEEE